MAERDCDIGGLVSPALYPALTVTQLIITSSLGDYPPLLPTLPSSSSEALEQSQGDFRRW